MTVAYGHKFLNNYGAKDSGIWLLCLQDLTRDDLVYGLKKMLTNVTDHEKQKGESWPPNAKEFRLLCEKTLQDFGLPTVGAAFRQYEQSRFCDYGEWSHPVVYLASKQLVRDEDARLTTRDIYSRFKAIYDDYCQRVMDGEQFNPTHYANLTKRPKFNIHSQSCDGLIEVRKFLNRNKITNEYTNI